MDALLLLQQSTGAALLLMEAKFSNGELGKAPTKSATSLRDSLGFKFCLSGSPPHLMETGDILALPAWGTLQNCIQQKNQHPHQNSFPLSQKSFSVQIPSGENDI